MTERKGAPTENTEEMGDCGQRREGGVAGTGAMADEGWLEE